MGLKVAAEVEVIPSGPNAISDKITGSENRGDEDGKGLTRGEPLERRRREGKEDYGTRRTGQRKKQRNRSNERKGHKKRRPCLW